MEKTVYLLLFWNLCVSCYATHTSETCYYLTRGYLYCEDGCCEDDCCSSDCCEQEEDVEFEAWIVLAAIGGVIGGILLISFVICGICFFIKSNGKTGRVIQPQHNLTQPPPYTTTVAYAAHPYPQTSIPQRLPPIAPISQNYAEYSTSGYPSSGWPEGLASDKPTSTALPGNHYVV